MSDEPTERDMEALRAQRDRYRLAWQSARRRGVWRLRWNLGIAYAKRIAEASREGAAEALGSAAMEFEVDNDVLTQHERALVNSNARYWLRERAAALRGDA